MTEMAMLWKNRVIGSSGNLKRKPQGQLPYARVYGRAPHDAEREPCAVGVGLTNRVWFSALKNSARNWRLPSSTHHRRTTVFGEREIGSRARGRRRRSPVAQFP